MARREAEREDLMREAVALVSRLALGDDQGNEIVIGFRRDGSGSIYVNQDPAWHFNRRGEFRRGYQQGILIKAEGKRLYRLRRVRELHQVVLLNEEMTPAEQNDWVADVVRQARHLLDRWKEGTLRVVRAIPDEQTVIEQAYRFLEYVSKGFPVADSPSVRDG